MMTALEKDWKKNLTVPNFISFIRILLIGPFVYCFLNEKYIWSVIIVAASGISDMLDGMIARKFNQISELGKLLDPLADKLTLVAIIICVGILIPQIIPLVTVLVAKDLLMLLGGAYLLKRGIKPPAAKWYGKISTVIFYISIVIIVCGKAFLGYENSLLTVCLLTITTGAMLFSLVSYFKVFLTLLKDKKDKD